MRTFYILTLLIFVTPTGCSESDFENAVMTLEDEPDARLACPNFKVRKDIDGDGVGRGKAECADELLDGFVLASDPKGDCNNRDETVYPGAPEILGNGTDDDCNPGTPDEETEITVAFIGPAASYIDIGGQEQLLFKICIGSNNPVWIDEIPMLLFADDDADSDALDSHEDTIGSAQSDADGLIGPSGANLTDIKMMNVSNGAVMMGPMELMNGNADDDAVQEVTFNDGWSLFAETVQCLNLVADVNPSTADGTTFAAALEMQSLRVEDWDGSIVPASQMVPSSNIVGYSQTADIP